MSVRECVEYICRERGIELSEQKKSRKLEIDRRLDDLREMRDIDNCELRGVHLSKKLIDD